MDLSNLNFYGLATHEWIGVILPFASQKEQSSGSKGWGWRYRVAIMGYHPNDQTLKDEEITYALVALGVSDGSGAAGRQRTPRISQGDVVLGKFLDGDKKQVPLITNVLGRTTETKHINARFGAKTGFVGGEKPGLTENQESNERVGPSTPLNIKASASSSAQTPTGPLQNMGISPSSTPATGVIKAP